MGTVIRPELSEKNKYWIDKHRYYELKHFCLQYVLWKKAYADLSELRLTSSVLGQRVSANTLSDQTGKYAILRTYYADKIEMVEQAAIDADADLHIYILKGVTEGLSYTYLKNTLGIPCAKDTYYDRYRRFFWLLNEARD